MSTFRRTLILLGVAASAIGMTIAAPSAGAGTGGGTNHPTANPGLGGGYGLSGIACSAATACTAVGYAWPAPAHPPNHTTPLAERWNGASWSIQPTPAPAGAADSRLANVSCSTAFCMAVGYT